MRLAELEQKTDALKTLYVSRPLSNADTLIAWAKDQGFEKCLPAKDMHVTIAYSKTKVDWDLTTPMKDTLRVTGGKRDVGALGDGGAIVLHVESDDLHERWQDFKDELGCSWDHSGYQAHVTITYDGKGMETADITPFDGPLVFGPEVFKELDLTYLAKVSEKPLAETIMSLGHGLDPSRAYHLFRDSYERETGSAWSEEKFLSRARNWTFFGDDKGFVAVRKQASGPMKLVGVAGDTRSILKGLDELKTTGSPIWGAVSAPLARMAQKRGMIAPHSLPGGSLLIRALIKTIPNSVFGGAEPEVAKDGGLVFDYADTGRAEKYLVGNKAYFAHAMRLPHVIDALKAQPAIAKTVALFQRLTGTG